MALLFIEGFDWSNTYANSHLVKPCAWRIGYAGQMIWGQPPRGTTGYSAKLGCPSGYDGGATCYGTTFSVRQVLYMGAWVKTDGVPSTASGNYLELMGATNENGFATDNFYRLAVQVNNQSQVEIYLRGSSSRKITCTGPGLVWAPNTWCYVEFKCTWTPDGHLCPEGGAIVRVNGVEILRAAAGQELRPSTNAAYTGWVAPYVGGGRYGYAGKNAIYDDFYVCDDAGGAPFNGFLHTGAQAPRVEYLPLTGPSVRPGYSGNFSQYPTTGDPFAKVSEFTGAPDQDTTYIADARYGNTCAGEHFRHAALSNPGCSPLAVFFNACRRTDAAESGILAQAHLAAAEGATTLDAGPWTARAAGLSAPANDNKFHCIGLGNSIITVNPQTGRAWTVAEVNNSELGAVYI